MPLAFNRFGEIAAGFEEKAALLVERTAMRIEQRAKETAPVLTGNLRNSVQVGEGMDATSKRINVGAEYGVYVEYGTSKMGAQPYLVPSVEAEREGFMNAIERIAGGGA